MFAYCPHCTTSWTNTEFAASYLVNCAKVPGLSIFPDGPPRRLKAMAVEYQQRGSTSGFDISTVVEGGYNLHLHTAASCFGKSCSLVKSGASVNNKRKAASQQNECRYRYPQRKKRKTTVQNASDPPVQWFLWDGTHEERYIKEVCPERHSYDAFQNVSCRAISHSKLACNTNVSIVMDGPTGKYSFKYNMKGTQKDDE